MKFFQKRPVAAAVMVLAIVAGILLGQARKPDTSAEASTAIQGSYTYVMDSQGVISDQTAAHIDAVNASLFAQTGAQIAVEVVETTGSQTIDDYAQREFTRLGVGSAQRNNGILLVLALKNVYNGAAVGDYYMAWGSGWSTSQENALQELLWSCMERDFAAGDYDSAVLTTFDAMAAYAADAYSITVRENYIPAVRENYSAIGGGYQTETSGYVAPSAGSQVRSVILLLVVLLVIWMILDAMRYRRYRRRYMMPGMGTPTVRYYPVFWGRPRRRSTAPPRRNDPPRGGPSSQPPKNSGGRPPSGGSFGGGSFGGGTGRSGSSRSGGFGGGSFGGGAGRGGFGGGSFGGGAGRSGFGGGSFGGGAGRGGGRR
jgi:uncharacterized membrane protein YgcG